MMSANAATELAMVIHTERRERWALDMSRSQSLAGERLLSAS
jgi:hypothetical protein